MTNALRHLGLIALASIVLAPHPRAEAQSCAGDCNADTLVAINELIVCVRIAAGSAAGGACVACDVDGNGGVTIAELIAAVNRALTGCPPAPPTATATPLPPTEPLATVTPTPSATPTRTITATPIPQPTGAFRHVAVSAQGATRLALASLDWFALLDESTAAALAPGDCPGAVTSSCVVNDKLATRTTEYTNCLATTASGHQVRRDGVVVEQVNDPGFCSGVSAGAQVTSTIDLDYSHTETHGSQTLARLEVDGRVQRTGLGVIGCAGPNVEERFAATVEVQCAPGAESVRCPASGATLSFTPQQLVRRRLSGGAPCNRLDTASGRLGVSDAGGDPITVTFDGFALGRTAGDAGGGESVSLDGRLSTECLGAVSVRTQTDAPLQIPASGGCPIGGELEIGRPNLEGAASPAPLSNALVAGTSPLQQTGSGLVSAAQRGVADLPVQQRLYRSARGQVYQVLQNPGAAAALGAEAVQITTLVGSTASVAQCANAADALSEPQAVAAASGGRAMAPGLVRKSARFASAGEPCFNRNARAGDGQLCLGSGCTLDCGCAAGGACQVFTLADGRSLAEATVDAPAATLVDELAELADPCSGFAGRSTYRFGSGGPTVETRLCAGAPADGLRLPAGSSMAFVYPAGALALFNAGFGGFPIDVDGQNSIGCAGANRVLNRGEAGQQTAGASRVAFDPTGAAGLDYDGDDNRDAVLADCAATAPIACADEPPPPPTPDPTRPCAPVVLAGDAEVTIQGSTAAGIDEVQGASCGWGGGGGAPDKVFEYTAAANGIYDVTLEAAFDAYLYVRRDTCRSEEPELACNADEAGDRRPRVRLDLAQGDTVAIVVDGAGSRGGGFTLGVRRRRADLVVSTVVAPGAANAGEQVIVSTEIVNQGDGDAGPFSVEVRYARDASLTQPLGEAGVACAFDGLLAGQRVVCRPGIPLRVPLVGAGPYVIGARVDPTDTVIERDETNNVHSEPTAIEVVGAELEQRLFRAADGSAYHLVRVVPSLDDTAAEVYRVTTLAAATGGLQDCSSADGFPGGNATAAVGAAELHAFGDITRSSLLEPNDAPVRFEPTGSGRLTLGGGASPVEVCQDCAGQGVALVSLADAGGGLPAACLADPGETVCGMQAAPAIAFGLAVSASPPACAATSGLTLSSEVCREVPEDGFDLRPGQAVVFTYAPGLEPFEVGIGAFGIDEDGANSIGCTSRQVVDARALTVSTGQQPSLTFVEAQRLRNLDLSGVTFTADGRYVYMTDSNGAVLVFHRDATSGELDLLQIAREGEEGIGGLSGASALTLSPDERHLYVTAGCPMFCSASDDALVVFARNRATGLVSFVQANRDGVGGADGLRVATSVAMAGDGRHLYVAGRGDDALAAFARDPDSGEVDFLQLVRGSEGGPLRPEDLASPRSVAVSPDGRHVYAGGTNGVTLFSRDVHSGLLNFVAAVPGKIVQGLAVSLDGAHVYAATSRDDFTRGPATGEENSIAVYIRDPLTGQLSFEDAALVLGQFPRSVRVTGDGGHVYAHCLNAERFTIQASILAFLRDRETGRLSSLGGNSVPLFALADETDFYFSLGISQDAVHGYVIGGSEPDGAIVVLQRADDEGRLEQRAVQQVVDGVPELRRVQKLLVSPDGAHVYTPRVSFSRDVGTGRLTPIETLAADSCLILSPDGHHAYSVGAETLTYSRNAATGRLDVQTLRPGLTCLGLAISPGGEHLYIAEEPATLHTFSRDASTGELTLRGSLEVPPGFDFESSLAVSPDGRHLYAGVYEAIEIFSRDGQTGAITPTGGVPVPFTFSHSAESIALSATGEHVYVVGHPLGTIKPTTVIAFARNSISGALQPIETYVDDDQEIDGFDGARSVVVTADGGHVFVAGGDKTGFGDVGDDAVTAFSRDALTGRLTFLDRQRDGVGRIDGLDGPVSMGVAPDGRHLYVAGEVDSAVSVFALSSGRGRVP
jgi:6-phosphogluconolactonase (cycloisomerase 2 family)